MALNEIQRAIVEHVRSDFSKSVTIVIGDMDLTLSIYPGLPRAEELRKDFAIALQTYFNKDNESNEETAKQCKGNKLLEYMDDAEFIHRMRVALRKLDKPKKSRRKRNAVLS